MDFMTAEQMMVIYINPLTYTVPIIIIVLLTLFPQIKLFVLWLVRLDGYTVNLCLFYFYRFIGKLTDFLQLQEFS